MLESSDRTSQIMAKLTSGSDSVRISVGEIITALEDKVFALMLVLLGLPNCLPMPPPIALISGLLTSFVAVQMILGFKKSWLPKRLLNLTISRSGLERTLVKATPHIKKLEQYASPRLLFFTSRIASSAVGLCVFLLALAMVLAVPIIGQIPLGVAICLIGLGLVEHDGLVIIAGLIIGAIGVVITGSVVGTIILGFLKFT